MIAPLCPELVGRGKEASYHQPYGVTKMNRLKGSIAMKNAVLFNYYIGDSTFGGVIAYIDDRETAKKFASDIEVGMSYALYEQDFRHLFNVAKLSKQVCTDLLCCFNSNPDKFEASVYSEDEAPDLFYGINDSDVYTKAELEG